MPEKTGAKLARTVVLVGMPGAGKSAVGRALAERLGAQLRDSDAEIEARARLTIAEIFERDGEPFFRARESEVLASLLDGAPCVLSTGGGAWLSEKNRAVITARAAVIWLKADLELLWSRVGHRDTRPLLRTADPKSTLTELKALREPAYAMAQYTLEVSEAWSVDETTQAALDLLEAGGEIVHA